MKNIFFACLILISMTVIAFGIFWFNAQPVLPVSAKVDSIVLRELPLQNKRIIEFIEANGRRLAPTYKETVCTEFVIKVIDRFEPLTKTQRNDIRIITTFRLDSLVKAEAPVIKGVQTALVKSGRGILVKANDVLPGDFVQFWNVFEGDAYGHCGVVLELEPNKSITLYSSHPFTGGYGTQEFFWPDKIFFARLK